MTRWLLTSALATVVVVAPLQAQAPQSGEPSEGQSTGRCSQRPSESLQAFFWQN